MENTVQIRYFSGYIRNFKRLCDELGISLPLSRDEREKQILIKGFKKWGVKLAEHLYGAFAFAVEDGEKLYVFRDQVGQKQMFYAVVGGELLCSDDIDEIVTDSRFTKKLNMRMLQQYLFYGYPIGEETFYEGVYKLSPGHYLEWDGKDVKKYCYFKPLFKPETDKSIDEFAEDIKAVVNEILNEEREDTELPYKESFLSGGVDSSYLLAASDAQCANTVGYAEEDFNEAHLARDTAAVLGKDFRVKTITPEEYFDRIPTVIDKMGQPLGDASAVAFSLGCQAVKEHADVVYSGEGIDEFFGGYNAHKRVIPSDWVYLTCSHIMSEDVVKSLMLDHDDTVKPADPLLKLWEEAKKEDQLDSKLTMDIFFWLEGDIYLNTDRTSTACGIELHTPFSDYRLFEVASRIPAEYQLREEQNKYVFRMAASSVLPHESAFRKKVGFPVPVRKWLSDARYNKPVEEKLFGATSQKFFNQDEMKAMWDRFIGGESLLWNRIYAIYAFLLWYDLKF
ncbi:MAG: asparagine synthetase B [Ruminococcus sp.]|uniref:asparagine synthetase B family protein n=1 Tax=Ruminococcus sp. TaxID=41978 RepID=UPI0028739CEE|nr:asparagine synthase-related protein [Ruminococcus sp.]MBQ3286255.1 asparagine synthetase B [Ruminococcus sp.]